MSTALRAFQIQLDTTGHNISNVDTAGYSRQSVTLTQADPTTFASTRWISIGNGVSASAVNRVRDMFLEGRRLKAGSDLGKLNASTEGLGEVESVFSETNGTGISTALDKFWNAWSSLSANPNQSALRQQVQSAGQTLADRIRGSYLGLNDLKNQNAAEITQSLKDLQNLANQVAQLNTEIKNRSAGGGTPNDLEDLRDQAVRKMSEITDVSVSKFSDGSYIVSMGGKTLVDQDGARTVPTTWNAATGTMTDTMGTYTISSGKLAGYFDTINKINSYQTRLDNLANNLRTTVNTLHATGTATNGATGLKFFNDVTSGPQTGAIDFDLDTTGVVGPPASAGVKNDPNAIAAGTTGNSGDGAIALALSKIRDATQAGLGGETINGYYSSLVSDVGRDVSFAKSSLSTQTSVVTQIDNQVQSISGVSLDEEMANMLRFQRSYQAAAKALSTFNSVMDDLLAMLR